MGRRGWGPALGHACPLRSATDLQRQRSVDSGHCYSQIAHLIFFVKSQTREDIALQTVASTNNFYHGLSLVYLNGHRQYASNVD